MGDGSNGQEQLLKQLVSTFRCPCCRRAFEHERVRVAARHEQLWIVSVRCSLCRNQQVFWVALKHGEGQPPRDTTDAEEVRFSGLNPISGDDVLDMHELLRDWHGDLASLLS